ncbi:MAG: hypothetical protein AMDU4_FER2C00279G0001 [Ferroplasma sp. Type II]|nr:MAG: hypothetical protein AMDU4_FER2C00279G0001 [Ferroplasma sp. Type II]
MEFSPITGVDSLLLMFNDSLISLIARYDPSLSVLFITKISPISIIPDLIACISSPSPGARITHVISAIFIISTSAWPDPTVSSMTKSLPDASRIFVMSHVYSESPPLYSLLDTLLIYIPLLVRAACILILFPSMAPPENGLAGSIARTETLPWSSSIGARLPIKVLFPTPGGPVIPMILAFPYLYILLIISFLDS